MEIFFFVKHPDVLYFLDTHKTLKGDFSLNNNIVIPVSTSSIVVQHPLCRVYAGCIIVTVKNVQRQIDDAIVYHLPFVICLPKYNKKNEQRRSILLTLFQLPPPLPLVFAYNSSMNGKILFCKSLSPFSFLLQLQLKTQTSPKIITTDKHFKGVVVTASAVMLMPQLSVQCH